MNSPVKIWRNQKKVTALLGKTGTIVSWTMIRVPPGGFSDQAPYAVVIVELDEGGRMEAQLVDATQADCVVGGRVVAVVRRIMQPNTDGVIPYGIKVKPV